jgi:hypothetical protein
VWQGITAFNLSRGILETTLETAVMEELYDAPSASLSVGAIFRQARQDGVALTTISGSNLNELAALQSPTRPKPASPKWCASPRISSSFPSAASPSTANRPLAGC